MSRLVEQRSARTRRDEEEEAVLAHALGFARDNEGRYGLPWGGTGTAWQYVLALYHHRHMQNPSLLAKIERRVAEEEAAKIEQDKRVALAKKAADKAVRAAADAAAGRAASADR